MKRLTWDDFTIDHIDPYSKGGRSRLENAALMCRSCNSSKGKR
ncbi:MAG: HNH endonuclease [Verrucomicrobia bacterium]|nr:HNH endonuclease [Verrucomicrobiota bacterium]